MKTLPLAGTFLAGMVLGACAITGAAGFDLNSLGDFGKLVEQVRHGTEESIETAGEVVAEAKNGYCNAVPGVIRERARAVANADDSGHQIGIWCVGDPPLTLGQ